jgi:hypothetical protein
MKNNNSKIAIHISFVIFLMYCGFRSAGFGEGIFYQLALFWSPFFPLAFYFIEYSHKEGLVFIPILLNSLFWTFLIIRIYRVIGNNVINFSLLIITYLISIVFIVIFPDYHSTIGLWRILNRPIGYIIYFGGFVVFVINNIILIRKVWNRQLWIFKN